MVEICPQEACTACTACYSICPHKAISMPANSTGFIYPIIDSSKCVDCGACVTICPVNNLVTLNEPQISYAAYSKDKHDRDSSASGGVASVLAEYILKQGGVVYGCVQNNLFDIKHERIAILSDLHKLKGSKYVHSHLNDDILLRLRDDLKLGLKVLFTGTPCQCAGVKAFLHKDYEELYLMDLCCHGVPSQYFLKENIKLIQRKGTQIKLSDKVYFRSKDLSVPRISYGLILSDNHNTIKYHRKFPNDYFISGFMCGIFFRENCFNCKYAQLKRCSDITVADHWANGKSANPEMNVHKGLSTILINTNKGQHLFNEIHTSLEFEERSMTESINGNGQFLHAQKKPKDYALFQQDVMVLGYEWACKKYLSEYMLKQKKLIRIAMFKQQLSRIKILKILYHIIKR